MYAIKFPLCLGGFPWQALLIILVWNLVVSALGITYGNVQKLLTILPYNDSCTQGIVHV